MVGLGTCHTNMHTKTHQQETGGHGDTGGDALEVKREKKQLQNIYSAARFSRLGGCYNIKRSCVMCAE